MRKTVHLGWGKEEGNPILIRFRNLCQHTAILAQSGAGKSTLIGRLVEEILVKTRGRVVVLDTNADFRKSHSVVGEDEPGAVNWAEEERGVESVLSRAEFAHRLQSCRKVYLASEISEEMYQGAHRVTPVVTWRDLPLPWQMEVLNLDIGRNPDEVAALYRIAQRLEDSHDAGLVVSPEILEKELSILVEAEGGADRISRETAARLFVRFRQAAHLGVWRRSKEEVDIRDVVGQRPQLLVLDIPSIRDYRSSMILASYLVEAIWDHARKEWDEAVAKPSGDSRSPVFVVVDEAHNFVPNEESSDALESRVDRMIQRIAAEGRKYGLFLIVATQRPPKVRAGFLAECQNVCLLRLQSPVDRGIAVSTWGLNHNLVEALARFGNAQGLLGGRWVEQEVHFKGGRRRTRETGGNLGDAWFERD